jgi:hypothetical protein
MLLVSHHRLPNPRFRPVRSIQDCITYVCMGRRLVLYTLPRDLRVIQSPARPCYSTFPLILSVHKHLAVSTLRLERNESRGLLPAQPPMRSDCNLCCNT